MRDDNNTHTMLIAIEALGQQWHKTIRNATREMMRCIESANDME